MSKMQNFPQKSCDLLLPADSCPRLLTDKAWVLSHVSSPGLRGLLPSRGIIISHSLGQ